ncbi:MAG TPA: serine--tRNA ligase, partial [Patescibacteria group bacterium]|nr:serine--tRNA ligase [Patescibacteria group bacterium]
MLDIKFIRDNPQKVQEAAKSKRIDANVDEVLAVDATYRELQTTVQKLQEEANRFTKGITGKPTDEQIAQGRKIKEELQEKEEQVKKYKEELHALLGQLPNLPKDDVKIGKDESENEVIKTFKTPTKFPFTPKDHLELGESLGIIDMTRAAKVSGARFYYLKGDGVLLEFALLQFALELLIKEGFTPVLPPVLIKKETMQGLGYMENGGEEDMFHLRDNDLILVGTAEQSLVPMHKDELLNKKDLPLRYVGYSSSFRREAGSYGKDTRGILRVHQFNKVEMVSYVAEGEDDREHEFLLSIEEKFFQALDIPYQVVKMCTGDLGFPAARKYDIEAWMPGQNKYREVTSVSTVTDFQSRRLNIKYRDPGVPGVIGGGVIPVPSSNKFVQILNGTAFAMSRTPIAILENYQQEDGSVVVPEVLRKYIGKDRFVPH